MTIIRTIHFIAFVWVLSSICLSNIFSQDSSHDKCGPYDSLEYSRTLELLGDHWGYGYEDLLSDLEDWEQSNFVEISSIGYSVEGRQLWEMKITDAAYADNDKRTVYIHARTHPNEVQGTWVTNAIIEFLLSDEAVAEILRSRCIFFILPMYNPDGVEMELPRENANGIDIESNWYSPEIQPEVISLRARFHQLMFSDNPINIALNMHSAFACKRYFVYHHENGTSMPYTVLEKSFISSVRNYYPEGIENWDYYISWTNGTPLKYPESWWWTNHGEAVMALTYEDMNCESSGNYEITGQAILKGIADYLDIDLVGSKETQHLNLALLGDAYPNPCLRNTSCSITIPVSISANSSYRFELLNLNGSVINCNYELVELEGSGKGIKINLLNLEPGVYYYRLFSGKRSLAKKLIVF